MNLLPLQFVFYCLVIMHHLLSRVTAMTLAVSACKIVTEGPAACCSVNVIASQMFFFSRVGKKA